MNNFNILPTFDVWYLSGRGPISTNTCNGYFCDGNIIQLLILQVTVTKLHLSHPWSNVPRLCIALQIIDSHHSSTWLDWEEKQHLVNKNIITCNPDTEAWTSNLCYIGFRSLQEIHHHAYQSMPDNFVNMVRTPPKLNTSTQEDPVLENYWDSSYVDGPKRPAFHCLRKPAFPLCGYELMRCNPRPWAANKLAHRAHLVTKKNTSQKELIN